MREPGKVRAETEIWPSLPLEVWRDSCRTLHMWTQIVGKVRLAQATPVNHWWQVPLYVTARGLTTSAMPYDGRTFQIDFDFIDHRLVIAASDGAIRTLPLAPRSVADFYRELMTALRAIGLDVHIWSMPVEVPDPIAFERDSVHAAYDPEQVQRFWRILVQADRVLTRFRSRFVGKTSPVHFFWGSFDLAVTRFSGRRAPEPSKQQDPITREAYSHEVSSCGFWPGSADFEAPAFYCYAFPEPAGFADAPVRGKGAFYHRELGQFLLPYEAMRQAASPEQELLDFLQSSYEAAADLGGWDRLALERAA